MHPSFVRLSSASVRASTIGFIGLGRMGYEMALNVFSKTMINHNLQGQASGSTLSSSSSVLPRFTVCDVNEDAANNILRIMRERFPGVNITIGKTPAEIAASASTIITMLPSSPHVQDVYLKMPDSIIPALTKLPKGEPTLCIDSTTLDVDVAREVAKKVEDAGAMMIDAPVSGGVTGAKAATLSFMVGGPQPSFTLAKPYLSLMGSRSLHCGPSGAGLAAKICNNLVLGVQQIVVAEAMLLGERMGLTPSVLAGVINSSTGRCWASEVNNPVQGALPQGSPPCERNYEGGFSTALMLKDMNLALHAASSYTTPLILGITAKEVYENVAQRNDLAHRDFSVVYQALKVAADAESAKKNAEASTPS